ncbi:FUSC family protein [Edwardsiella tarda]|uniref:FUSC family protein n=1 Tax=Edwardsiella tarda TaxID=636 RepID=UPI00351C609A
MFIRILKSFRLCIALEASLAIAMRLGFHSPAWAATSVLVVSVGTLGEMQGKWWQRIIGNTIGCSCSFFMIWWLADRPNILELVACLFCAGMAYVSLTHFLYRNLCRWIIIGFIIVFGAGVSTPENALSILQDRIGCVFIGSTVIFLLCTIWPIEYIGGIKSQYHDIFILLDEWLEAPQSESMKFFMNFQNKISTIRTQLSVNYADFRAIQKTDLNVINRLYYLENLGRHIYSLKALSLDSTEVITWVKLSIASLANKETVKILNPDKKHSLIALIEHDFSKLKSINNKTSQLSLLRWQWQNRMFSAGTDSPLVSTMVMLVSLFLCMTLWRAGWPNGGMVMMLTAIIMVSYQYGERMSPKAYFLGFSGGCIYAFPFFILILPMIHNQNAFWLYLLLMYFPLAFMMNGTNKKLGLLSFGVAVISNTNSHNYIPMNGYFELYTDFIWVVLAVMLISSATLSLLVVNDTETRLSTQIKAWANERQRLIKSGNYNQVKTIARLERRTEIILSMYSKLDPSLQRKWQSKVMRIPLMLTRIQRWSYIKESTLL